MPIFCKVFHASEDKTGEKVEADTTANNWIDNQYESEDTLDFRVIDIKFSENPYGAHLMVVYENGEIID